MRNFLLLCMAALCCLACNDSKIVTVTVTNPLAMDRSDEMVEVSMTEISNLLNLADTAQIVVLNVEGEQVPYQVTYDDKLIFPATVAANASAAYTVQAGTPVDVEVRACGRQYPERLDDMAWENDLVGFRAYGPALQARGERGFGYDLFTKRGTAAPVLEDMYAKELDADSWKQVNELRKTDPKAADELVRTWIYVQGVDTHYAGMVRARKEVFDEEGLTEHTHYIASTGIEGRFRLPQSLVYMDAYAIRGMSRGQLNYLHALEYLSPTSNYGVTFERGSIVNYGDRNHIFISGTASIDKHGEILYPQDVMAQAKRALMNILGLLSEGGANFDDLAQLIVYLRDPADYPVIKPFIESMLPEVPAVYVLAPVCRPGWLIEMECMAVCPNMNDMLRPF